MHVKGKKMKVVIISLLLLLFAKEVDGSPFVYICSADSPEVFVIDSATQLVTTTIPITSQPTTAVASPNGATIFVGQTDAKISVIECATNQVVSTIPLSGTPCALAVSASANTLIVSTRDCSITIFDITNYTVLQTITDLWIDSQIATSPDGKTLCISNKGLGVIFVYTRPSITSSFALATTISKGLYFPTQMVFKPDGTGFYVLDVACNTIHLINATTYEISQTINVSERPLAIAISANGATLYVTTDDGNYCSCGSRSLLVIQVATLSTSLPIKIGHIPSALAISPGASSIYVTDVAGIDIYVINALTHTFTTIDIMHSSNGIAWSSI